MNEDITQDEIKQEHQELKKSVEEAFDAYDFWNGVIHHPEYTKLQKDWEAETQTYRIALESAKSEELKTLQSDIRSRKAIIRSIDQKANAERLRHAKEALEKYEANNAMFLDDDE